MTGAEKLRRKQSRKTRYKIFQIKTFNLLERPSNSAALFYHGMVYVINSILFVTCYSDPLFFMFTSCTLKANRILSFRSWDHVLLYWLRLFALLHSSYFSYFLREMEEEDELPLNLFFVS